MSDGFVTVSQCVEGLPIGRFVWELLFCAFMGWFFLGAVNELTPMAFSFVSTDWSAASHNALLMPAALALGNFIAIIIGGWFADAHGRISVVRPAALMTIMCGTLMQTAHTFEQALSTRFILGLVSGGIIGVLPPLLAELLPSRNRGFYLTIWCSGWPAGSIFALVVGCVFPRMQWHAYCTIMLMPAVFFYVVARADCLPESPRYLYLLGRRDEGYSVLAEMYEKEQLMLPWAAETVSVTCSSSSVTMSSSSMSSALPGDIRGRQVISSNTAVTVWLAAIMFCVSSAAQASMLWMPTMIIAQNEDADGAASGMHAVQLDDNGMRLNHLQYLHFAGGPKATNFLSLVRVPLMLGGPNYNVALILLQAYAIEFVGVILCAFVSTWASRKHIVQRPLLAAAAFTFLWPLLAEHGHQMFLGPLLGAQLVCKAATLNFLQVFVAEHFPTSRRAQTSAIINFAAQLGNFVVPLLGGFIVRQVSAAGALICFGALYVVGWVLTLRLPLSNSRLEEPLLDVDERHHREKSAAARQRRKDLECTKYQTI